MALAGRRLMWLSLASRTEVYGQAMQESRDDLKTRDVGQGFDF
jgi:hypothetical protein